MPIVQIAGLGLPGAQGPIGPIGPQGVITTGWLTEPFATNQNAPNLYMMRSYTVPPNTIINGKTIWIIGSGGLDPNPDSKTIQIKLGKTTTPDPVFLAATVAVSTYWRSEIRLFRYGASQIWVSGKLEIETSPPGTIIIRLCEYFSNCLPTESFEVSFWGQSTVNGVISAVITVAYLIA